MSTTITRIDILPIAERFSQRVKSEVDENAKVYLFGSFARNDANEHSDIDIAVVSRTFGKDISKDYGKLAVLAYHVNPDIEAHPIVFEDWLNTTPFAEFLPAYLVDLAEGTLADKGIHIPCAP